MLAIMEIVAYGAVLYFGFGLFLLGSSVHFDAVHGPALGKSPDPGNEKFAEIMDILADRGPGRALLVLVGRLALWPRAVYRIMQEDQRALRAPHNEH